MIKVYTKPNCPKCEELKHRLSQVVEYEVVDVTRDSMALAFLIEQGYSSVPQVFINGEHTNMYNLL